MKNRTKKSRIIWILLIQVICLLGCGRTGKEIVWGIQTEKDQGQRLTAHTDEIVTELCTEKKETEEDTEAEVTLLVYADICGAVQHPGVYELEEGARIFELIEKAGGLQADADLTAINQAEKVTDGMKVRVYTKEEAKELTQPVYAAAAGSSDTQEKKININNADQSELTQLSGIGSARAADIIAYRTEHGRFQSIEEIMNVSGIKESTFQKIKDQIVVE